MLLSNSKSYADPPLKIDQRMDELALIGKSVGFIFQVISDGTPDQDIAYWLAPRLGP
jgi:hypothetical protein